MSRLVATRLAAAEAELDRLCNGGRFIMSIPAREGYDSDLLIQAALSDLRDALETDTIKENCPMGMHITDDARAEAWRRFPDGVDVETGEPVDDYGYPATAREAFIAGAEWAVLAVVRQAQAEAYQRGADDWADEQGRTVPNPYAVPEEEL